MSVRRWPDTLPLPSAPDFALTPVDQNIRTQMEVGAARVRTRTKARQDRITMMHTMTEAEFTAFRAWFEGDVYSLVGASDDLAGWSPFQATVSAGAALSAEGIAVDRVLETATSGAHRVSYNLSGAAINSTTVVLTAALKAAGRSKARLAMIDRASTAVSVDIDLTTGQLSGATGILRQAVKSLGNGWYRFSIWADTGVGMATPIMRINIEDDTGAISYTGDVTKGLDICDVQARIATGYDLFLPTDTDGTTLGAANGSAWFNLPVVSGGGLTVAEARYTSMFNVRTLSALNRMISSEVEVRNA
jgi:hypothetical protein